MVTAQQTAVAQLVRHALEGNPQSELAHQAVEVAARVLGAPYGAVWVPDGDDSLRLLAGTGWPDDAAPLTGQASNGSQPGFTLRGQDSASR